MFIDELQVCSADIRFSSLVPRAGHESRIKRTKAVGLRDCTARPPSQTSQHGTSIRFSRIISVNGYTFFMGCVANAELRDLSMVAQQSSSFVLSFADSIKSRFG